MIRARLFILATVILATTSACDKLVSDEISSLKNTDEENCECYLEEKPEYYDVKLKITINEENPEVPITVFYGNVQRNNVAKQLNANESIITINLKTNHEYTYQAKYLKGSDTVYVPIKAKLSTDTYTCHNDTCWKVNNNVINLKLK